MSDEDYSDEAVTEAVERAIADLMAARAALRIAGVRIRELEAERAACKCGRAPKRRSKSELVA